MRRAIASIVAVPALAVALAVAFGAALAGALAGEALAAGAPQPAGFADVPPCHWAAGAVRRVAGEGIFVGFPPDPAYDSVNALRQVFEGLQCGRPSWSLRFVAGAPGAFGRGAAASLASFRLEPALESVSAGQARVSFRLSAVVVDGGRRRTLTRQGNVTVVRSAAGWQAPYAQLAALDLPLFPR